MVEVPLSECIDAVRGQYGVLGRKPFGIRNPTVVDPFVSEPLTVEGEHPCIFAKNGIGEDFAKFTGSLVSGKS